MGLGVVMSFAGFVVGPSEEVVFTVFIGFVSLSRAVLRHFLLTFPPAFWLPEECIEAG